ncbi:MAG: hypothetical protein IJF50_00325 [Peptococcaceae bacterium]|nr:hypothetical protein [Peptococcaceae bacterium]
MEAKKVNIIHYAVVFALCFLFRFLPPIGQVTPYGMGILGTFIGAIYGWSTIGMAWTSLMCLVGIGWSIGANQMIAACFNMTVMGMLFIMFIVYKLNSTGATTWIVNSILCSKFTKGKPWLTLALLLAACYMGGVLNSLIMAIVFVGVYGNLFKSLNVPAYSKLITCTLLGSALAIMMGQIGIPVMGNTLMLIAIYNAMVPIPLDFVAYMIFMIPMGIAVVLFYIVLMKFVFRVDVTPLKEFDPSIFGEKQPATKDQKLAIFFFVFFMVLAVCSSIAVLGPVFAFLGNFGLFGFAAVIVCIMMLVKGEDGKPFLNFYEGAASVGWDAVLMVGYIMVISTYMNTADTGISQTLMGLLTPFTSLNPLVFIVFALFFAMILTNIATNLIIVAMVMPILFNFAGLIGMSPTMLILLLFIFSHFALATPAAAPPTGVFYTATDLIKPGDLTKYALITLPLIFIFALIIGIPYASIVL